MASRTVNGIYFNGINNNNVECSIKFYKLKSMVNKEFLKTLCQIPSPSGYESKAV